MQYTHSQVSLEESVQLLYKHVNSNKIAK